MQRARFILFHLGIVFATFVAEAQDHNYLDSMKAYQQHYVAEHEVVQDADKKYFQFYEVDPAFRVIATLDRIYDLKGFDMLTSSGKKKKYYKYGLLSFSVRDTMQQLFVYQSADLMQDDDYKDYLFVPFGDVTSGIESYGGGRYLEFIFDDIKDDKLVLDFNKAYNPYCTYAKGYNCPIPPIENLLTVSIEAGEKNFAKPLN